MMKNLLLCLKRVPGKCLWGLSVPPLHREGAEGRNLVHGDGLFSEGFILEKARANSSPHPSTIPLHLCPPPTPLWSVLSAPGHCHQALGTRTLGCQKGQSCFSGANLGPCPVLGACSGVPITHEWAGVTHGLLFCRSGV